ncbi:8048_t:CDS:1, partial [Racocetra fulgida]
MNQSIGKISFLKVYTSKEKDGIDVNNLQKEFENETNNLQE